MKLLPTETLTIIVTTLSLTTLAVNPAMASDVWVDTESALPYQLIGPHDLNQRSISYQHDRAQEDMVYNFDFAQSFGTDNDVAANLTPWNLDFAKVNASDYAVGSQRHKDTLMMVGFLFTFDSFVTSTVTWMNTCDVDPYSSGQLTKESMQYLQSQVQLDSIGKANDDAERFEAVLAGAKPFANVNEIRNAFLWADVSGGLDPDFVHRFSLLSTYDVMAYVTNSSLDWRSMCASLSKQSLETRKALVAFSLFDLRPAFYQLGKMLKEDGAAPAYYHSYETDNLVMAWYSTFISDMEDKWQAILEINGDWGQHTPYLTDANEGEDLAGNYLDQPAIVLLPKDLDPTTSIIPTPPVSAKSLGLPAPNSLWSRNDQITALRALTMVFAEFENGKLTSKATRLQRELDMYEEVVCAQRERETSRGIYSNTYIATGRNIAFARSKAYEVAILLGWSLDWRNDLKNIEARRNKTFGRPTHLEQSQQEDILIAYQLLYHDQCGRDY